MDELGDLIARVEGATGADRALDAFIKTILDGGKPVPWEACLYWRDNWLEPELVPPLTASIDAALALCERVAGEWTKIDLLSHRRRTSWSAELSRIGESDDEILIEGRRLPTPALALLSALLRALQASTPLPTTDGGR
jgi:hypothetical protein